LITQKYLKSILNYNEKTGDFIWVNTHKNTSFMLNKIAGNLDSHNYIIIRINKKAYKAHRLAWLYVYGEWPKNYIDHINGIRNDNRIENLQDVTKRKNQQNQKLHRQGNLVGASYHKASNKWQARILINGIRIYLGLYNTELEAHNRYLLELNKLNQ